MARCEKTQTLFEQMSLSDVDSVHAWKILSFISFMLYTSFE